MAELTITVAQVLPTGTYTKTYGAVAEAVTQGQVCYQLADQTWKLAQNDGTALESGSGTNMGIAIGAALTGQFTVFLTGGTITIGTALVVAGTTYYVGATAGSICLFSDIATGGTKYISIIGYATTTAIISVSFNATGLFKA